MNGGYIMIKASDADIYTSASRALNIGKPILFYENDTTCYYIDTITLDDTNIVLTKGGKTITIANDNTITTSGDIQNHLYEHNISISNNEFDRILFKVLNNNNTQLTYESLVALMTESVKYQATGYSTSLGDAGSTVSCLYYNGEDLCAMGIDNDNGTSIDESIPSNATIVDTISQLF